MGLLIFYLALAIGISFFCSIAEAVLLSIRPSYVAAIERDKGKDNKIVKNLQFISQDIDRPLAAILTANTIAHTIGAAGVGAQSAVVFGSAYLGITSALLTLAILLFSEIIPKTLGATHWKKLAPVFSMLIFWLTYVLHPFVWMSEKVTGLISSGGESAFTFSRDEMEAMAEIGAKEGVLEHKELKILSNLMQLNLLSVRYIMTPRTVIFSLSGSMTVKDFFEKHASVPFSRIPIFKDKGDNIIGYALKNDLFIAQAKDEFKRELAEFVRSFTTIPDTLTASKAFDILIREKTHMALIVDEYGTVQGIVTLEDIVETLVGLEITDELDTVEDMQELAHKKWKERISLLGIDPDTIENN